MRTYLPTEASLIWSVYRPPDHGHMVRCRLTHGALPADAWYVVLSSVGHPIARPAPTATIMIRHLSTTRTHTSSHLVGANERVCASTHLRIDQSHQQLAQGWSDDPVCQYLRQIGQYSLLTRQQEIALARRVELTRRRFRLGMLECDFVLRKAVGLLKSVQAGELPLKRTLQVALSDRLEEHQIRGRLPHHLRTLDGLLPLNRLDYQIATGEGVSRAKRREAWRRLTGRRRRAARLVEELGLRMEFIESEYTRLVDMDVRVQELLVAPDSSREDNCRAGELYDVLRETQQTARGLHRRTQRLGQLLAEHQEAKRRLCEGNLRLVVAVAKKYRHRGLNFIDLIQEGNAGLMRGVEKFEYRLGFKFSTYASWWIRQAVSRAVADQSRTIRVPSHMLTESAKVQRTHSQLLTQFGREPTLEETAQAAGTSVEHVKVALHLAHRPLSLAHSTGRDEETTLGELFKDDAAQEPAIEAGQNMLRNHVGRLLHTLTQREREVLQLRFGLIEGHEHTLEEVAGIFHVTRERIRQIERRAISKLQHPRRSSGLVGFLDSGESTPPGSDTHGAPHDVAADGLERSPRDMSGPGPSKTGQRPTDANSTDIAKVPSVGKAATLAIQEGVRRGDSVADLELLGLSHRTISMLEGSKFNVITLRDLVGLRRHQLTQIQHFGEGTVREIFDCLARYDQLEVIKSKRGKPGHDTATE